MSVSVAKSASNADLFGEGPHWEVATQSLLYVDMRGKAIHRWNPATDKEEVVKLDIEDSPSLVVPRQSGGYVVTHGTMVSHLEWSSGTLTTLETLDGVDSEVKVTLNDGKCDRRGRLWAGTFPAEYEDILNITPNQGYVVSVSRGSVEKRADNVTLSNGIAWSADERTMYFADTLTREILAFDFDVNTGTLSNRRVAVAFPPDSRETLGLPDGMTIDTDGNLWVACVIAGKVACFDPDTGRMLRTIHFPVNGITSCCFGGKNMDELFVTSASREQFGEETGEVTPGSVFKVTGLGVKGRPDYVYQDTQ